MQNRGAYDSARILVNELVRLPSISNEQKLRALLAKQFSFYYLGRYDSLRAGMAVLEKEIGESDGLYPELLFVRGLQKGEDAAYSAAIGDLLEAEKRVLATRFPQPPQAGRLRIFCVVFRHTLNSRGLGSRGGCGCGDLPAQSHARRQVAGTRHPPVFGRCARALSCPYPPEHARCAAV